MKRIRRLKHNRQAHPGKMKELAACFNTDSKPSWLLNRFPSEIFD